MTAAWKPELRGPVPVEPAFSVPNQTWRARDAVVERLRLRLARRIAWLRSLYSAASASEDADYAGRLDAGTLELSALDAIEAERRFYATALELLTERRALERIEQALGQDTESRLARLCDVLGVSAQERDVLEFCLALAIEPGLAPVLGTLQGNPELAYPSEALAAKLYERQLPLLSPSGAAWTWKLLRAGEAQPGEPVPLELDPFVLSFLTDGAELDPVLEQRARQLEVYRPLASWPIEKVSASILQGSGRSAMRVVITGAEGAGRRSFAAAVADRLDMVSMALDTTALSDGDWPKLYVHAERQALLFGHCLVWYGSFAGRRPPPTLASTPVQFVVGEEDLNVEPAEGFATERVMLSAPDVAERRQLWRAMIPQSVTWSEAELAHIAERYRVYVGDIAGIAQRGVHSVPQVKERCLAISRDRLGELGQLLDCPFEREDLRLSALLNQALDDFLFEAKERVHFWEQDAAQRLFPRGRGLVALMAGPPGTGKTMAAQVVAKELGLSLVRIDLATAVSKYIGETAKNLRRIFLQAKDMNAVLLFDEADALFSKRTEVKDAHDRYANTDTNYLLQLLEDFNGVALLASNKKSNIDPAFVRRIRYVMEFSRPGPAERLAIWQRLVRELVGSEVLQDLESNLRGVAGTLDLSGAQIKLSLLAAVFIAKQQEQRLSIEHLWRGIEREFLKEGRALSARDRQRTIAGGRS